MSQTECLNQAHAENILFNFYFSSSVFLSAQSSRMRVIIATRAHEIGVEVGVQEPVLEIKCKIERLLGIPVASQTLAVFGWELVDGLDMDDYPIVTEGTRIDLRILHLEPPPVHSNKIQVIVKFSTKKISVEVDSTDTVRSLKEKIHVINSTPIKRMMLYFSGIEMSEDFRNLIEYGISQFSEIVVFLKTMSHLSDNPPRRRLDLVVQTSSSLLNAATIPLEMEDCSTICELRQLLLSNKILPLDDYLFIHKQRIMRDKCSLHWHGVENGDRLYVFKGTVSQGEY
ncbi:uncharacterized protein LOC131162018 [Malania oleifera]|uniref:uncharacterized protein LOC131162018 n=1 Tax=Malania oleifera TaxID=397392 RepID=UPI0025AEB77B|nr:uncharacterized protein LOC131162018 [Malania oleifera]